MSVEKDRRPSRLPKLLTEQEVQERWGVPVSSLRSMRSRANKQQIPDPIPFVKIGNLVRYREDDLVKWLERNTFDNVADFKIR